MIQTRSRPETRETPAEPPEEQGQPLGERARAAAYLDLWERHVSETAMRCTGIAAPWFKR